MTDITIDSIIESRKESVKKEIRQFLIKRLRIDGLKLYLISDDFSAYQRIRKSVPFFWRFCPNIASVDGDTIWVWKAEYYRKLKAIFDDVNMFFPEVNYKVEL